MSEASFIDVVHERIKSERDQLTGNALGKIEVDSFNLSDFWEQFGSSVQSLSNEVTKIGFMCGKKPYPKTDELNGMLQDMLQHYNLMRDLYMILPEEVGATVYGAVTAAVLGIMNALLAILHSLNDLSEKGAKERLTLTGSFWDACNSVESLPRNNLNATLKILEEETALAADAQEELTTVDEKMTETDQFSKAESQKLPEEVQINIVEKQSLEEKLVNPQKHESLNKIHPVESCRDSEKLKTTFDKSDGKEELKFSSSQSSTSKGDGCNTKSPTTERNGKKKKRKWVRYTHKRNQKCCCYRRADGSTFRVRYNPKELVKSRNGADSYKSKMEVELSTPRLNLLPRGLDQRTALQVCFPSPEFNSSCPQSFRNIFPTLSAADLMENLSRRFANLDIDTGKLWKVYRSWQDEHNTTNVIVAVDDTSLRYIEGQSCKIRLYDPAFKYFAYFRDPSAVATS